MKALVIALNYHIGHLSHMIAYYSMLMEIGYDTEMLINEGYVSHLPKNIKYRTSIEDINGNYKFSLIYTPCKENNKAISFLKKKTGTKIAYVFHEPIDSYWSFRKAGFSWMQMIKLVLSDLYNARTTSLSDCVILSSEKAFNNYNNRSLYINKHNSYIPLIFTDEQEDKYLSFPRTYFSYIGTIAADHSFDEYLDFITWAIKENKLPNIKFLIATKSEFIAPQELLNSNRVVIQKGRPMSNEEINSYYASTIVVWNAYARTTQSGVLAKSFMFGTPALVLKKNCNEFAHDGIEIKAIEDNTNKEEILSAIEEVQKDFDTYSANCRKQFLNSFYYRKYNEAFASLIESL